MNLYSQLHKGRYPVVTKTCSPAAPDGGYPQQPSVYINAALTSGTVQTDRFSLTWTQRWALRLFSEGDGGRDEPL